MPIQVPFPIPSKGYALNSKLRVNLDFIVDKFNEFNSGTATWDTVAVGTANNLTGTITLYNSSTSNFFTIQAGATGANLTFTLPIAYPSTNGAFLKSTTGGVLSFSNIQDIGSYVGNRLLYLDGFGTISELDPGSGTKVFINSNPPQTFDLLGTTNQITVTPNAGNFTFSLPQSIATTSTVDFGRVRLDGGSASTPTLVVYASPSATNTGLFSTGLDIRFSTAGTLAAIIDGTDFSSVGELHSQSGDLVLEDGTGNITIANPGSLGGSYTLTLPANDGDADQVLTTDGSGNLSWEDVSGVGGASTALDNLASVAINTSLISDTNNTDDLGSNSIRWRTGYFGTSVGIGVNPATYTLDVSKGSDGAVVRFTGSDDGGRGLSFTSADSGIFLGAIWTQDIASAAGAFIWSINSTECGRFDSSGAFSAKGTNTNDNASAGWIGQSLSSTQSTAQNAPTSTEFGDLVSISLTAGDWDISGTMQWNQNGATWSDCRLGISSTSGNSAAGLVTGESTLRISFASSATTPVREAITIAPFRVSLSGTTTYYLKYAATYSAGTPTAAGRISARRVR